MAESLVTIKQWMIYGAYGYTGRLIAEEAVRRGHQPILAGRDEDKLLEVADALDLPYRVFTLDHPRKVKNHLQDVGVLLHCAGPFIETAEPVRTACIESGCHYLDITGEIDVLEASYNCHEKARAAGVTVISGVGFDVVPTDILACLLKQQLPTATHLQLAFAATQKNPQGISPGTAKTILTMLPNRGKVRENGEIITVPLAYKCRTVDFADQPRYCMTIPWGDVATAFYSTDIPNIEVYTEVEEKQAAWMRRLNPLIRVLNWVPLQKWLRHLIGRHLHGPDAMQRQHNTMQLWGQASDGENTTVLTMTCPEGYHYTVNSALLFVEALLAHKIMPGAYTPSQTLELDAFTEMEGVTVHYPDDMTTLEDIDRDLLEDDYHSTC